MFVQVIQGKVRDPEAASRHLERWRDECCPGASGLLGATGGVTDDGRMILVARWRSQGDAGVTSARPVESAWWQELDRLLDGPLTFHDCNDVALVAGGGDDDAGFVQIIQARDRSGDPLPKVAGTLEPLLARHRPDVMGAVLARAEDGTVTETVYFTSEQAAREHEAEEPPEPDATTLRQLWGVPATELEFHDLHTPLLI